MKIYNFIKQGISRGFLFSQSRYKQSPASLKEKMRIINSLTKNKTDTANKNIPRKYSMGYQKLDHLLKSIIQEIYS